MEEKKPKIKMEEADSQQQNPVKRGKDRAQEVVILDDELPTDWKAYVSKTSKPGKMYYFNAKSGIKSWFLPTSSSAELTTKPSHQNVKQERIKPDKTVESRGHKIKQENVVEKYKHIKREKPLVKQERNQCDEILEKNPIARHAVPKIQVKQEVTLSLEAERKRKSTVSVESGHCKKMYLDQPMLEEPNATLYQNVPPLGEEAGTSIPENLNSWLHSHLEDAHVESMDWESSDVNVLPSMEVFEASYCWHIVVDTNVLLDSLEFVHQLRDLHNKKFGLTVIAIPWAALQELDRFKSEKSKNPKLREPAKRAIAFIHKSFSMSHPKLIGQFSLDEDIKPIRITYDDSIIKYSLTLKCEGKNVILLTEDKNLCNKATTAQLECHSVNGLKEWINFALNGAVEKDEAVEKNDDAELLNDVPAGVVIKCAKKTMVKFLGKVLETEMKSIYNEMWSKVVLIKPPWSFEDILKCYEKHWIAALSSLFQKPALDVVKKMIKAPAFKYSQTWELIRKAEVLEALDMCIELCSSLKSVKYTPHSLQAIEQLKPLKEQLKSGKVIASPTEDLCLSSSGFSESIEKDKINHCLNSTFQSINSFCCEVNRLVDGPYEKQLENAVGQSIMTYHRMIKSLIQLNEKLLSSKENCDIKDLTEMSALLLRTNMLKDQNSNIDSISMIALREFYMSNRETLTQAQDVLLQSSNIVSRGMKRLMSFSQNTTSF